MNTSRRIAPLVVAAIILALAGMPSPAWSKVPRNKQPKQPPTTNPVPPPALEPSSGPATSAPASAPTSEPASKPAAVAIAYIRMAGKVTDSPPGFSLFTSSYMTLRDWLQRLATARNDDSIKAVALELDSPHLTWAHAQELADAVKRLDAVKPVYVYMTHGGATEYLVASAGRDLAMEPTGSLRVTGLGAEMLFFRSALDWLGVKAQMVQIGRFKGAAEPMTRNEPSEELKDQYNKLLDDLYDQLCQQIATQRKLTVEMVKAAIDEAPLNGPEAQKLKFVDHIAGKLEWRDYVAGKAAPKGVEVSWEDDYAKKAKPNVDFSSPFAVMGLLMGKGQEKDKITDSTIAIIHADGVIVTGRGESLFGSGNVGSRTLVDAFEQARKDDRIKAVIFRIESPGGSALASEQIHQAVKKCAACKPVIASISSVGASGGYYIAVGTDTILADPSAIIGSIGVISGKLAITGLMEKLNVGHHEITRGKNAGLWLSRPWDEREENVMRKDATDIYNVFVKRVTDSRGAKIKDITQVAEGRVFTARQAAVNGLIDRVGGMREVTLLAQEKAGLKTCNFVTLPKPKTILDMLTDPDEDDGAEGLAPLFNQANIPELRRVMKLVKSSPGLQYLLTIAELMQRESCLMAMPHYVEIRP